MSEDPAVPAEPGGGRRAARLAARRRRRRRAMALGGVALAVVAVLAVLVPRLGGGAASPEEAATASASPRPDQRTLLLVRAPQEPGAAKGVTLFAAGPAPGEGAVVFLPVGTLMNVPGHGLDRLGAAHQYGGAALVQATVENTLGITVDAAATVSDAGLAAFLGRVGSVEVSVPQRLVRRDEDGEPSLRFASGEQHLDGPRLVEYLSFLTDPDDELGSFSRQEQVWEAVFAALSGPDGQERLAALVGDGAPQLDATAEPDWLRGLFAGLAAASDADALTQALLPVEPFGGPGPDGGGTYRLDSQAATELMADLLAASEPEAADPGKALRVEVLNGVGTPGIGQAVHRRLQGAGFRIVRTDNARSFDFIETQILAYAEADLPAARRLRDLLGVGTISVSRRPQSVVDLTVVVGADFAEREGREP